MKAKTPAAGKAAGVEAHTAIGHRGTASTRNASGGATANNQHIRTENLDFGSPAAQAGEATQQLIVPPKPKTHNSDLHSLPAVFKPYFAKRVWVCWRWTWNAKRSKWDKPPLTPLGYHASSTNPATWCSYEEALSAVDSGKMDGVGIALHGVERETIVYDLDDCRSPETGEINAWAKELIDLATSYTEVTPSGTGLRAIGSWEPSDDEGRGIHRKFHQVDDEGSSLEIYTGGEGRYITVTGNQLEGCWPNAGKMTELTSRLVRDKGRLHPAQPEMPQAYDPKPAFEPAPAYKPGRIASALGFANGHAGRSNDELLRLIAEGVPEGQRSEQFHHAVGWAKRIGWTREGLEQVMRQHPGGIASKYLSPTDRLVAEITRCWGKVNHSDYGLVLEEAPRARASRAEPNSHGPGETGASGGQGNAGGDTGSGEAGPETSQGAEFGQGAAGNAAPEPKPAPLWNPWREYSAPEFPLDVLPLDVRQYVEARATETGACISAIAMCCLTAISGAITHEAKLYLKHGKNYEVRPRLWTVIVGDPSSKKSPAMDGALRPLRAIQRAEQGAELAKWHDALKLAEKKSEVPQPELIHYIANDLTPEALVDILSKQDRGLLMHYDELAGFFGSLDRYGSGGNKGAAAGRGIFLQTYNGGPFSLHRIGRHTQPVANLSISILGGIQPERLRDLGNLSSDGMLQRFLPVMMRGSRLDSENFNSAALNGWDARIGALLEIERFSTELSSEAQAERRRVAAILHDLSKGASEGAGWQAFVGKLAGVWGNLALILHVIWGDRVSALVSLENAQRASRLLEDFVLPHGLMFYRTMSGSSQTDSQAIGAFLAEWQSETVSVRDLGRGPRCCRKKTPEQIVEKLAPFETGGWVAPEKPGPWNRNWAIAPGLAERFAEGVAQHKEAVALIQSKIVGDFDDE